jgi:hypothetical protein
MAKPANSKLPDLISIISCHPSPKMLITTTAGIIAINRDYSTHPAESLN